MDTSTIREPKFQETFDQYYKLKNKYDKTIGKEVAKISTQNISGREKAEKFKSFKRKCINCGREGGTIFTHKDTFLIAKCGNSEQPCNLDIKLDRAINENINSKMSNLSTRIISEKQKAVNLKLDYLFNFKDREDTTKIYETLKKDVISTISEFKKIDEKYNTIVNNKSKESTLKDKEKQLFNYIKELKSLISSYEESGDVNYINNSIEIYNNIIKPLVSEIQNLKYEINYVYFDEREGVYCLVQENIKPSNLESANVASVNKVITFKK